MFSPYAPIAFVSLSAALGLAAFPASSLLTAPAAVAAAAVAEDAKPFAIDPVHSHVGFRIKHLNVAFNYGRFNDMSGSFLIDEANPANSRIEVTIKADSVDTANDKRDGHLKSQDFFSVKEFPTISFKSSAFKKTGSSYELTGDLTFRGQTKPITATLDFTGKGPGRGGGEVAGIEAKFSFKRSDFGMTYLLEGLSDEVNIIVALEGSR